MAIHLFIDTNVYLKFYHYSNDDLEELKKLSVLMDNDELELYLPKQVMNEFHRNRDVKLADALNSFRQSKLNNQFPQFCKGYPEYETLKRLVKEYDSVKSTLLHSLMTEIESNSLQADEIIKTLFDKSNVIETEENLVSLAKRRFDLGNPPGKNKSYGDAINWECLLFTVEKENDLHFIADDKDYFSEIDNSNFNTFLANEWRLRKKTEIKFHKTLSGFFKEVFPDIKLATEYEKNILLAKLEESRSFYDSRKILRKLAKYDSFSSEQADQYISSAIYNSQIYRISRDEDINEYLHDFAEMNKDKINPDLLAEFYNRTPLLSNGDDDFLPF